MKKAIFPGSFDPVTKGHINIIERGARLFDELIVVILQNSEKQTLFRIEERLAFLQHATAHIPNVTCMYDDGLTVDFARKHNACAILRGIRSIKDYEYEMDIASVNHHIAADIETIVLFSEAQYHYVSSTMIREMLKYKQDVSAFVNDEVYAALKQKI